MDRLKKAIDEITGSISGVARECKVEGPLRAMGVFLLSSFTVGDCFLLNGQHWLRGAANSGSGPSKTALSTPLGHTWTLS